MQVQYHEFVAICRLQTSDIFSGIAWYYGDNNMNFNFIAQPGVL